MAHAAGAQFFTPTVLTDVTREMRVNREEIFGPVAPLIRLSPAYDPAEEPALLAEWARRLDEAR